VTRESILELIWYDITLYVKSVYMAMSCAVYGFMVMACRWGTILRARRNRKFYGESDPFFWTNHVLVFFTVLVMVAADRWRLSKRPHEQCAKSFRHDLKSKMRVKIARALVTDRRPAVTVDSALGSLSTPAVCCRLVHLCPYGHDPRRGGILFRALAVCFE
jgi:hypothetical protein